MYGAAVTPDETDAADVDRAAIADVVKIFFSAFISGADSDSRFEALRQILLPEALIVRTCGARPDEQGR